MNELEILNKFETGAINELTLEDLTNGAAFCLKVSARTASVLAVTVAKLRKEHLTDVNEWSKFCKATFDLEGSYLHQIHKVGKMLLSVVYYTPKVYTILFNLCFDKQLPITQISAEQIDTFIKVQTKPLGKMTRAEVRAAVSVFLGKTSEVSTIAEQPALPGFDKWLNSCAEFEPAAIVNAVASDDTAHRSFSAGCLLLGAALDYQRRRNVPDTNLLMSLKAALLDEIQSIENILAGV